MNPMTANKRLIGVSVLVVAGTITLAEIERHERLPGADQWIGLSLAFFIVSVMADLKVPIAGGLAVLMMVATLLVRGDEALAFAMTSQTRERQKRIRRELSEQRQRRLRPSRGTGSKIEPQDDTIRHSEPRTLV